MRNTAEDVDDESFSFQTYMELIRQGQTVALDMLFTPEHFYCTDVPVHHSWREIVNRRGELIHKGTNAFVGYTKAQAAKYGNKGERLSALNLFMKAMKHWDGHSELGRYADEIASLVETAASKEAEVILVPSPNGPNGVLKDIPHLSLANRKVSYTCTVDYARQVYQFVIDKYGYRAKLAENANGVDWKATMHAVRIAAEAKELLLTGHITFPRPEAELLLAIRQGKLPYAQVEELIDQGLIDIKAAELKSTLREDPNHPLMDRLISDAHWSAIRSLIR